MAGFPYRYDGTEVKIESDARLASTGATVQAVPGEVYELIQPYAGSAPFTWAGEGPAPVADPDAPLAPHPGTPLDDAPPQAPAPPPDPDPDPTGPSATDDDFGADAMGGIWQRIEGEWRKLEPEAVAALESHAQELIAELVKLAHL